MDGHPDHTRTILLSRRKHPILITITTVVSIVALSHADSFWGWGHCARTRRHVGWQLYNIIAAAAPFRDECPVLTLKPIDPKILLLKKNELQEWIVLSWPTNTTRHLHRWDEQEVTAVMKKTMVTRPHARVVYCSNLCIFNCCIDILSCSSDFPFL